jgi:signal transduction histidine kinase
MQIRRKISFIFTLLTSLVLLCAFSFVYYLTYQSTKSDFSNRLLEKADLIAQKYYEEDELSRQLYQKIIDKNSKSLPEANEITLDIKHQRLVYDSLKEILPEKDIKRILSGKNIKFSIGNKQGVGLYYPDNQGTFIIVVTAIDVNGLQKLQNLLKVLVNIFLGSIVLIYFIGLFYSRRVLSPIGYILNNVKKIRVSNLKLRLTENNGKDELGELTRMFNQMLERLEHAFDMQKNFIHNASHELKNPLTAILGETEIALSKKRTQEEYIDALNKIAIEAERLDLLTRNLLNLAQTDFELSEENCEEIRMDEFLWEIKDYFDKTDYKDRLFFHLNKLPENSKLTIIMGISNLLKSALINLIDNACKFSGHQKVDITLTVDNDSICLIVSDKGIGVPENEVENLFQPFFRASNAYSYKGSGIGLSLAGKIIKLHGGNLAFQTSSGIGTTVEVRFNTSSSASVS